MADPMQRPTDEFHLMYYLTPNQMPVDPKYADINDDAEHFITHANPMSTRFTVRGSGLLVE